MSDWKPIAEIPLDEEVKLLWKDGTEAIAMKISPPPRCSPDEFCWGVNALSFDGERKKEYDPRNAIGWKPLEV